MTDTLTAGPSTAAPPVAPFVQAGLPLAATEQIGPVAPVASAPAAAPVHRLYLTSDLRAATGLSRTHMDFYLREGIVVPTTRTESGFLLFDERELHTLQTVLAWRRDGVGIKEIRARLGR